MPNPEADEKKVLGNAAYAFKDYDEAINQYTAAIALDSKNCVYFSNRSAAYAVKGDWNAAANDAQECVNINPSFFKGYYRLARAQLEQKEFEAALATINSGLDVGTNDREQKKLMRKLKAEVKEAKDEEYRKTAAAQMQDLMESLGLLKRKHDPQGERKAIEELFKDDKCCMHGINPMHVLGHPEGRFYEVFKKTFIGGFNNVTYQTMQYRLGEHFLSALEATEAKFPEEWKDESKIGVVVTNFVAEGTMHLLHGKIDEARIYASYAFFIQDFFSVLNKTKAMPSSARAEELYNADEHTLVSFLRKHIPCSCLEEKYKEVKSTAKMSRCYNEQCSHPNAMVERSKVKPCAGCRQAYYCSRECQKADVMA
ncbi:tetratricopeptide repeat-containing protein [Skeletonema marinoi]|uniref:Tetratricopeptide repeat-containing protein n=1 Tax=Skeletonema marinoi TaxID=267567 RepID=A0AAD8Y8T5_9STRA|nr:tetratricopeptide repeat-containing protein [Skeletonema marinoi]